MRYETLIKELTNSFPEMKELINEELEREASFNEPLPHVFFGYVFNPFILEELASMRNKELLKRMFKFLELMAISKDKDVKGVLTATILERLGDDKNILERARKLMGKETSKLSHQVERSWGREG
jgi:hypothetical protein